MKWHKISDGDYPVAGRNVIVCMRMFDGYTENGCFIAYISTGKYGDKYWCNRDFDGAFVSDTDRWAYIDLPKS